MSGEKINLVKGKVEIEKDEDSKKEQSGKEANSKFVDEEENIKNIKFINSIC